MSMILDGIQVDIPTPCHWMIRVKLIKYIATEQNENGRAERRCCFVT